MARIYVLSALAAISLLLYGLKYFSLFALHCLGWHLQNKTKDRRESILASSRVRVRRRKTDRTPEDEDWEKVEGSNGSVAEKPKNADWDGVVAFFHPFCAAGGGGERVLWAAVLATQKRWPKATCVVYSGDHDVDRLTMVEKARSSFGIILNPSTIHISYLSTRHLVLASTYPNFTLLGQSLGSVVLAYDAFSLVVPDVFIDTMGYAFASAFCKYLFPSIPTAAYVHYPTISTDMLASLDDKTGEHGVNSGAGSGIRGRVKRAYWELFARLYGWVGGHIDRVMCNSSWTRGHITALWKPKRPTSSFAEVVYPPCPVEELERRIQVSADNEKQREHMILYTAQFRQEKNHSLILRAFEKYYKSQPGEKRDAQLVLIGSVRSNTTDEKHVYNLRLEARERGIGEATKFITDASFALILQYLQKASIGVNGMWNEHFGIGVVEYLAAGLIPVVHNSGGPKLDIVVPYDGQPIGFHAETDEQFAEGFRKVSALSHDDKVAMRLRGRTSANRFSEEVFARKWVAEMEELIKMRLAGKR